MDSIETQATTSSIYTRSTDGSLYDAYDEDNATADRDIDIDDSDSKEPTSDTFYKSATTTDATSSLSEKNASFDEKPKKKIIKAASKRKRHRSQ